MDTLIKNITLQYGHSGQQWLNDLPAIIQQYATQYHLRNLKPVKNMSHNYVASGYQHNKPIILKLSLNQALLRKETLCLQAFSHLSAVAVIAHDDHMILMQQALPGTTLQSFFPHQDNKACHIVCDLLKQLHTATIPSSHDFYYLKDILNILDEKNQYTHQCTITSNHFTQCITLLNNS